MIYAQSINNLINLIGGNEVGLPLSEEFLSKNPNLQCVDITNLTNKPIEGNYYKDGVFYTTEEWHENNNEHIII